MLMFGLLMVYRLILHFVLLCLFNLELKVLQSPLGPTSILAEPNNPNQLTLDTDRISLSFRRLLAVDSCLAHS